MDSPDPEEPSVEALGTHFNTVKAGTPFVVDTGASSNLIPYMFNRRARKGQNLEHSDEHHSSSLVARVRNFPRYGFANPQFHDVVFDDHLSTIHDDTTLEDRFVSRRDYYGEETIAPEGASDESPIEEDPDDLPPKLGGEWLSAPEQQSVDFGLRAVPWTDHAPEGATFHDDAAPASDNTNQSMTASIWHSMWYYKVAQGPLH